MRGGGGGGGGEAMSGSVEPFCLEVSIPGLGFRSSMTTSRVGESSSWFDAVSTFSSLPWMTFTPSTELRRSMVQDE